MVDTLIKGHLSISEIDIGFICFFWANHCKNSIKSRCQLWIKDEELVIGLLEFLQTDKKIKTLTDTSELTEDAVFAATVEQNSGNFQFSDTNGL